MTDDDRVDVGLRQALAARDPGPAPERLRARLADVPLAPRRGRWWLPPLIGVLRPVVAAIATAAALIVGILVVSVVRPALGPSGVPSPGPGAAVPSSAPDLGVVGPPLALPVPLTEVTLVLLLLVLYRVVDGALERATVRDGVDGRRRQGMRRLADRVPRRVLFLGLTLALLAGGGVVLKDATLAQGGMFQASLVHLEGMGQVPPSHAGHGDAAYFRYVPGGTVTVVEAVENAGHLPITIIGVMAGTPGIELRLFSRDDPSTTADVDIVPTYAFAPIEIGPGQERKIAIVFHIAQCPGVPVPSSEPSPDLSGDYVPPVGDGWASVDFDGVDLDYSVLGLAQTARVPFFATVIIRSPNGSICDLDQGWGRPSPSPH